MNCPNCNASLAPNARFCGVCGMNVPVSNESAGVDAVSDYPTVVTRFSDDRASQDRQAIEAQQTLRQNPSSMQPGTFQPTIQSSAWPQSQPQQNQANPMPAQPTQPGALLQGGRPPSTAPNSYAPGMAPATVSASDAPVVKSPQKRSRAGCLVRTILSFVLLIAILAGVWIVGVRPYVHNLAQSQIDLALNDAQSQILLFQSAIPAGRQIIPASENSLNTYLSNHDSDQLQNLRMVVSSTQVEMSFTVYGIACAITALPIARGGVLQVTNVQVQFPLSLIMSNDELTTTLNTHFTSIGLQMHRTIEQVVLKAHEVDIVLS